jgi:uncharacterized tellurite resistance protein B-like protein
MSLLSFFNSLTPSSESNLPNSGTLEKIIRENFPESKDKQIIEFTCLSGLLCRVAFVDLNISTDEVSSIKEILKQELKINALDADKITEISITQTKVLSGIENHRYTEPLCQYLDKMERFKILKLLFLVAASDGNADNAECEEIRVISKGLKLEQQHYAAARASVKEYLGSLK